MARRLVWADVRGGLLALVVLAAISLATLKYARVGALHGDRIRLSVNLPAAEKAKLRISSRVLSLATLIR